MRRKVDQWGEKGPCGGTMSLLRASEVVVRLGLVVQVPGVLNDDLVSHLRLIGAIAFLEHFPSDTHNGGQDWRLRLRIGEWCVR